MRVAAAFALGAGAGLYAAYCVVGELVVRTNWLVVMRLRVADFARDVMAADPFAFPDPPGWSR